MFGRLVTGVLVEMLRCFSTEGPNVLSSNLLPTTAPSRGPEASNIMWPRHSHVRFR